MPSKASHGIDQVLDIGYEEDQAKMIHLRRRIFFDTLAHRFRGTDEILLFERAHEHLRSRVGMKRSQTLKVLRCHQALARNALCIGKADPDLYGFTNIIVEDCVFDRALTPHLVNLFDMDAKYGDVLPLREVMHYLGSLQRPR